MPTFQVGDVVNLKSSTDIPTTIGRTEASIAHCNWLNKAGDKKADSFSFDVLEKFVSLQERFEQPHQ